MAMNLVLDKLMAPQVVASAIVVTSGVIAWLAKGIVERPFKRAAETFDRFGQKRIEVLGDFIHMLSKMMLCVKQKQDLKAVKTNLQALLEKEGHPAYLSYDQMQALLLISIDGELDEKKLKDTFLALKAEYDIMVKHIQDKLAFHIRYDHCSFKKRFFAGLAYFANLLLTTLVFGLCVFVLAIVAQWAVNCWLSS